MRTALHLPFTSQAVEVLAIEGTQDPSIAMCESELLLVAPTQSTGSLSGETVEPVCRKDRCKENGNILIEVEPHENIMSRKWGYLAVVGGDAQSFCEAISASISVRWS